MSRDGPPGTPLCYRLLRDHRSQTETVGAVLLIGVTILGTVAIVAFGSTAISDSEQATQLQRTEHVMTLLDSRGAMTALGDSQSQTLSFGDSGDGNYTIEEDAGWLRIQHINYTGSGDNETIYNASLGALVYTNGDTEVAYQGGGVWRKQGNGSVMVSPPEFHYRGSTLTLPVIQLRGSGSAGGYVRATVDTPETTRRVFPNDSTAGGASIGSPYNVSGEGYGNPIKNGSVVVTVHSEYYQGWASYFRARSDANVTVDHDRELVDVQLETVGSLGEFEMPDEGANLDVNGIGTGHAINNFTITLGEGTAVHNNAYFTWSATKGNQEYEVYVKVNPGMGKACPGGPKSGDTLSVGVYYYNGSGQGHHEWVNDSIPADSGPIQVYCEGNDGRIRVNLTSEEVMLNYTDIDSTTAKENEFELSPFEGPHADSAPFTQHPGEHGEATTFNKTGPNDFTSLGHLTNHYMALMGPDIELQVNIGQNTNMIDPDESFGTLDYDQGGGAKFITFLHITENILRVRFT